MRIGILTFHSQLNYGGVLQCWALVQTLRRMGHNVVVVDRWLAPDNNRLRGPFCSYNIFRWVGFVARGSLGCGQFGVMLRYLRTMRFVRNIGLTDYHFYDWDDSPNDLGVDCLVVGSDQLWHGGDWGDPRPYLLEGAPKIPAIAYAVSFGMKELPMEYDYVSGFKRFKAISMREQEAVDMVVACGFPAIKTVDPTQLVDRAVVEHLVSSRKKKGQIVCYFLSEPVEDNLKILEKFAKKNGCKIKVLTCERRCLRTVPKTIMELGKRLYDVLRRKRVVVCRSYGPSEFVQTISESEACITDSFHAVMFSSVFDVNCRFLKPANKSRAMMFARIEEFASDFVRGPILSDSIDSALLSIIRGECIVYLHDRLEEKRRQSLLWLENALKGVDK